MIVEVVTFRVRQGREQEFETHHQDWVRMLRRTRGFIGQTMMRSLSEPSEYQSEIRWVSRDYRDRFGAQPDAERDTLTRKGTAILEGPPTARLLETV